MAAAVATPTITEPVDNLMRTLLARGTIAISADPATYTTHGIACSFAGFDDIKSSSPPLSVKVWSQPAAGVSPSGYSYEFTPGTTQANGLLAILTGAAAQSPLAELTGGGAIPAGVSGDVIYFEATFLRL